MRVFIVFYGIAALMLTSCQEISDNQFSSNNSASAQVCDEESCITPLQTKADLSFSDIPIDTQFASVKDRLIEIRVDNCWKEMGCEWKDTNGVRHFFWYFSPTDDSLVVKSIYAKDFIGRPIGALGIGTARKQAEVLANVRAFLDRDDVRCEQPDEPDEFGPVECSYTLGPGWVQIGFDQDGNLTKIQFDGYKFT